MIDIGINSFCCLLSHLGISQSVNFFRYWKTPYTSFLHSRCVYHVFQTSHHQNNLGERICSVRSIIILKDRWLQQHLFFWQRTRISTEIENKPSESKFFIFKLSCRLVVFFSFCDLEINVLVLVSNSCTVKIVIVMKEAQMSRQGNLPMRFSPKPWEQTLTDAWIASTDFILITPEDAHRVTFNFHSLLFIIPK